MQRKLVHETRTRSWGWPQNGVVAGRHRLQMQTKRAPDSVLLTVFMEGTANPMTPVTSQVGLFAARCLATHLDEQAFQPQMLEGPGHYKLCFDGCGVSHGITGVIFAHGLGEQCQIVRQYVDAFVRSGLHVTLNFVGLSRGGIGGLYLAQELAHVEREDMVLNLLLFDPVPGNFISLARFFDPFEMSNTSRSMDVSHVQNLGKVVVLYPHEPLPDIAVHAPLIAKFPIDCKLTEDVVLGCHQGALWLRASPTTCLSFACIRDFLREHGSELDLKGHELNVSDRTLAGMLGKELRRNKPTRRVAHAPVDGTEIVRNSAGDFLCKAHRDVLLRLDDVDSFDLKYGGGSDGEPVYMLDICVPDSEDYEDYYD